MITKDERIIMKSIALCFKKYLKPQEASIYVNLASTQLLKKCDELGIKKTNAGYYLREDLDRIFMGEDIHGNTK